MQKANILWIGIENFSFPLDEVRDNKYKMLSKNFNPFVLSFSTNKKFTHKYINSTHFYLIPNLGKLAYYFPIYILILFFVTPCLVIKKNIDLVVCSDPFLPGIIGAFWKKALFFKRFALIIEAFGDWREAPTAYLSKPIRYTLKPIITTISKFSISNADILRAESKTTLKKLQSYNKKAPAYFFNLTHIELFEKIKVKRREHKNEFWILFIGRIVKLKGIQYVIDILQEIKIKFPNVKFLIGGEGNYLPQLKKQINNLKLEKNVKLLGLLNRKEVKQQLINCDLFILPSMSEGQPKVLVETMIMGKFMIASDTGSVNEIVKDGKNGFLVKPYDIKTLREKLIYVLNNKEKIKRLGVMENKKLLKKLRKQFSFKGYSMFYTDLLKKAYIIKLQNKRS